MDIAKILESKRRYRAKLAALPIEEKLRMLDALRERQLEIKKAGAWKNPDSTQEKR